MERNWNLVEGATERKNEERNKRSRPLGQLYILGFELARNFVSILEPRIAKEKGKKGKDLFFSEWNVNKMKTSPGAILFFLFIFDSLLHDLAGLRILWPTD